MTQKTADFFNMLFGFRKMICWIALFVVGIIFRLNNLLDGAQFTDLAKATFLGFVAGNSVERVVTVISDHLKNQASAASTMADNVTVVDSEAK